MINEWHGQNCVVTHFEGVAEPSETRAARTEGRKLTRTGPRQNARFK